MLLIPVYLIAFELGWYVITVFSHVTGSVKELTWRRQQHFRYWYMYNLLDRSLGIFFIIQWLK